MFVFFVVFFYEVEVVVVGFVFEVEEVVKDGYGVDDYVQYNIVNYFKEDYIVCVFVCYYQYQ